MDYRTLELLTIPELQEAYRKAYGTSPKGMKRRKVISRILDVSGLERGPDFPKDWPEPGFLGSATHELNWKDGDFHEAPIEWRGGYETDV